MASSIRWRGRVGEVWVAWLVRDVVEGKVCAMGVPARLWDELERECDCRLVEGVEVPDFSISER